MVLAGCGSDSSGTSGQDPDPATTRSQTTETSVTDAGADQGDESDGDQNPDETDSDETDSNEAGPARNAAASDLPLPAVAEGQLLFAGRYGPDDCTETRLGGTREATLGVACPGPPLPYWFTDAGELIVDVSAMTDDMTIYFAQDLVFDGASSAVVIEWSPAAGISRQFLAIENLDDLVRVEPPYYIAVVDVCQWDVVHDRTPEGARLNIFYDSPSIFYRLNVLPNPRFPSFNEEGFEAPGPLQDYMANRGQECDG